MHVAGINFVSLFTAQICIKKITREVGAVAKNTIAHYAGDRVYKHNLNSN